MRVTIFPHSWLSRRGEKKFHHEPRSGKWWNFYLPQLLGHEWGKNCDGHGNSNVPWVMNREFFPSQIPKMIGFTFLLRKWKFLTLSKVECTQVGIKNNPPHVVDWIIHHTWWIIFNSIVLLNSHPIPTFTWHELMIALLSTYSQFSIIRQCLLSYNGLENEIVLYV